MDQSEWWVMKEDGMPCAPVVGLDFVVYRLRGRVARRHPNHLGPWGVRLGPNASRAMAHKFVAPKMMPPVVRKASPQGIPQFLRNPKYVGCPASMSTDACLGFSVMA